MLDAGKLADIYTGSPKDLSGEQHVTAARSPPGSSFPIKEGAGRPSFPRNHSCPPTTLYYAPVFSPSVVNFGCQIYGSVVSPNIKEIADQNHYAFSPHPYFIAAFFSVQMVLQVWWMKQLFFLDKRVALSNCDRQDGDAHAEPEEAQVAYTSIYALGNFCIAGWMIFWQQEHFVASQILVTINTFSQLYAVFFLLPQYPISGYSIFDSRYWKDNNVPTHLIAKTFAGIGILDLIDNGGVATGYVAPPSNLARAVLVAGFAALALPTDSIFGFCLVYDLAAMAVGQPTYRNFLARTAGGIALLVVVKSFMQRSAH